MLSEPGQLKIALINVLILYGRPVEAEVFDAYFTEKHRPLLVGIPKIEQMSINYIAGVAQGDPPYYLIVELQFASESDMQEGLNSEKGQEMARDLSQFASGGSTILFAYTTTEILEAGTAT